MKKLKSRLKSFFKALAIFTVGGFAVFFVMLLVFPSTHIMTSSDPTIVEKEIVNDALEARITQAQDEARVEIELSAQEAYDYTYEQEMSEIRTRVRDEYIAELNELNTAEKKTLQSY